MIDTKINFHFCDADLPLIKKAAELHVRDIPPTHRLEILARGCGFNSMAALKSSLTGASGTDANFELDFDSASAFAHQRGYNFQPTCLYRILSSATVPKVARENPSIHNWGFGIGCLEPKREERQKIISGLPIEKRRQAVQNAIQSDLLERRKGLLEIKHRPEVLQALAFVSCIQPLKNPNMRRTSYGLKHIAENLEFSLPGSVTVAESYVSNTNLIAAALYSGFRAHSPEYERGYFNSSPNPEFNMSERSIKPLAEARRERRFAA